MEHLSVLRTNENQLLLAEFGTIPMVLDYSRDYAQQPHNMEKNRYDNIFPYDHNRVKLPVVKWQEGSDYINASYLDVSHTCTCCNCLLEIAPVGSMLSSKLKHSYIHVRCSCTCTMHVL